MYDYLIVGAGLFGSVFAYEATKKGKTCLVVDKRKHIGGNVYTENIKGINVHKYGAHIFHTSNKMIWDYIQQFATFNRYTNSPIAIYKDEVYNLPFNMNTFSKLWGIKTPQEAKEIIENQRKKSGIINPSNLEEQAISLVGKDIYEKLIKGYTQKQWGKSCDKLPSFIINRLPVRFTYDNNYFNDLYQGIPVGGYTQIFEKMLASSEILNMDNFQGNAVVNYTDADVPYTRIIEHKHFEYGTQNSTIITKEYPKTWKRGDEPFYPINNEKNNILYSKYLTLAKQEKNVVFGGRLGMYRYFDMHNIIERSLECAKNELD